MNASVLMPSRACGINTRRWVGVLEPAAPALFYGVRVWAAVCLALYVAFWLQIDNPYWAGVTVAIVSQPSLGASLRKARFYMIGTAIGAIAIVALTACFPQDRVGFLVGLALWSGGCGFVASMLRNFAAFAAALAGYTAAIIAGGVLGATGGPSEAVFLLALSRASDISIGIISATLVLSWTDLGAAGRRLSTQLASITAELAGGIARMFSLSEPAFPETRVLQRDLAARVAALDRAIDDAIGESSSLRFHAPILQQAVGGLFAALSGWRMAALQLEQLAMEDRRREAASIQARLPQELMSLESASWLADPVRARQACLAAVRALAALRYRAPGVRVLADQTAEALIGVERAVKGLVLLADPLQPNRDRPIRHYPADWAPCLINSARVFFTISAVELVWVATAWPNGALAITFAAIYVLLLTLQGDQAHATATDFLIGVCLMAALAATVKFAVLPGVETFAGFSLAIGLVLAPAGALIALQRRPAIFVFVSIFFILLVGPENQQTYDTGALYNLALAMFVGLGAAALAFRLLPPLSPASRAQRLLAIASRRLQALIMRPATWTPQTWKALMYGCLCALPPQAAPFQRAQLLTTLSIGSEILRLRRIARRFDLQDHVDEALQALGRGDEPVAAARFAELDWILASTPRATPGACARLRARGSILAISEIFVQQGGFLNLEPVR